MYDGFEHLFAWKLCVLNGLYKFYFYNIIMAVLSTHAAGCNIMGVCNLFINFMLNDG